jgi:hypothetical protein
MSQVRTCQVRLNLSSRGEQRSSTTGTAIAASEDHTAATTQRFAKGDAVEVIRRSCDNGAQIKCTLPNSVQVSARQSGGDAENQTGNSLACPDVGAVNRVAGQIKCETGPNWITSRGTEASERDRVHKMARVGLQASAPHETLSI